jgi:superfamily II DNA helicase RecQ
MEAKIFTIPFDPEKGSFLSREFEAFCSGKRVIRYRPDFFTLDGRPWWTVWIEYEVMEGIPEVKEKKGKELRKDFSEAEQALFKKMKSWRLRTAEEKGIPAYLVATDRQFGEMITQRATTLTALGNIQGYGKKRLDAYGKDIIEMIKDFFGDGKQE